MHEGLTLGIQREFEKKRGWQDTYSALTYCTAEGVIHRKPEGAEFLLDYEILDARRVTGAPDCVGKRQGKWGGYVKPTDPTPVHAYSRILKETFGWDFPVGEGMFFGIMGPELHKSTLILAESLLTLSILEEQAELTPFESKLFSIDATGYELGDTGSYLKATEDARWISVHDLIREEGDNKDYLYWSMIYSWFKFEANVAETGFLPYRPNNYRSSAYYAT